LWCDTEGSPEGTLRARLTDQYYEPIESQITALTTFHSRTILAQKVFDKMSAENVVNLVTWLISKPSKHGVLQNLTFSFDDMYWKQRMNRVRQTSYLFEQIDESSQVDILEFISQILQHQSIVRGKSVDIVHTKTNKICINTESQLHDNALESAMIGHQTILFNIVNEQCWEFDAVRREGRFSEEQNDIPVYISEILKNNGPEVGFSNPIETGYTNGDKILLFEPFVIKIEGEQE